MLNIDDRQHGFAQRVARRRRFQSIRTKLGWALTPARWIAICALALMLGACVGNTHLSFLDAQGPVADAERWHFYWVLGILVVLVAGPIFLVLPFFVWRYRYGNAAARYTPRWKYSRFLEIMSWAGPIAIVGVLAFFVWRDAYRLDPYKPLASDQPALRVQVIGYDWKWLFIYPDEGIATVGTMALPVGRPVAMHLTSATVMQSFFIPSLGSQIYAMGGMVTQLHLQASRPGRFLGENTMYNGNGFHQQKFTAVAMTPDGFQDWVGRVRATGVALDARVLEAIARRGTRAQLIDDLPHGASHDGSVYLSGVTPGLFSTVVRATMDGTAVELAQGSGTAGATTARNTPAPIGEHGR
jgi:cytochrome o ubiquinol oxidase subunit 2